MLSEKWLLARSKENFVFFFQKELRDTLVTGKKSPDLGDTATRTGKDMNIFSRVNGGFSLSPYTIQVLEDLSKMTQKTAPRGLMENAPGGRTVPGSELSLTNTQEVGE